MTIRFDIDKSDALAYLSRMLERRERERMISIIIVLPLVIFMFLSSDTIDLFRTILLVFIFVGIIGAVIDFYKQSSLLKKFRERNPHILPIGKYEVGVTHTGMNVVRNGDSVIVDWDEIWRSDETGKYLILYVSEKAPIVIPKRQITAYEVEELRTLLLKYIPEYQG